MTAQDLICPFCGEKDFDAIGLKAHLTYRGCEVFDDTPTVEEDRAGHAALATKDTPL